MAVVLAMDARNVTIGMDILQCKMLVAVLRKVSSFPACRYLLIDAAADVNKDGFKLMGDDVRVAVESLLGVLGMRVDCCVDVSKMGGQEQQKQILVERESIMEGGKVQ